MFGGIAPPLNASVRLPILVPHGIGNRRTISAFVLPLRFRGRRVAVARGMPSGVRAIKTLLQAALASAACGNAGALRRGHPSAHVSSGLSVRLGGVCRWRPGLAARSMHSRPLALLNVIQPPAQSLYYSVPSAYGRSIMRQPNYAFERTVKSPRNHRRDRAAAQRER